MPIENETPDSQFEEWQMAEIQAAMEELDQGRGVSHEDVARWLRSWGTADEIEAPV